jgi:hypothetical protein
MKLCIFVTVDLSELGCHNFLQLNKVAAVSLDGGGGQKMGKEVRGG